MISLEVFTRLIGNAKNNLHITFYISHQQGVIDLKETSWFYSFGSNIQLSNMYSLLAFIVELFELLILS